MVSLEPQRIPGGRLDIIIWNTVFIWIKWNLDKWWFSSGGVFSEQAGPHEAKMVSLEPQNIPGGHLGFEIWKYCVYLESKKFGQKVVFVGRGLLGADGSSWGENGVIGTAEHPRGTFGYYLKILCLSRLNIIWTNGGFRREGSSRSRRVPMRQKRCHWNRRASPGDTWILIFENIVFI